MGSFNQGSFPIKTAMTKSYQQIRKQIEDLERQAEKLRRDEVAGVIDRIRDAIRVYNLSAADLGLSTARAPKADSAAAKPGRKPGRPKKSAAKGTTVAPKFRDENGNTWAGRGKRPVWLRDALNAGKKLEDFAVK